MPPVASSAASEQTKELYRDQRSIQFFDSLLQDLRFALRGLRNRPGFALVAILTLAVGIGSTTSVFSVVDRILFRSLPYPHDDRLVSFGDKAPFEANEFVLGPDYVDWKKAQLPRIRNFIYPRRCGLRSHRKESGPPEMRSRRIDFPSDLRHSNPSSAATSPAMKDRPNAPRVAPITYGLWRSRFASDLNLPGRAISLDGRPTTVVGVLPPPIRNAQSRHDDNSCSRRSRWLHRIAVPPPGNKFCGAFARLKPGLTITQAAAAMEPLFQQSLNYVPPQFRREVSFRVRSLRDRQIQDARAASWVLLGAVLAVLLVAVYQRRKLASRARYQPRPRISCSYRPRRTRGRLARQSLTESLLLGVLGGLAGCWIAQLCFVSSSPLPPKVFRDWNKPPSTFACCSLRSPFLSCLAFSLV